MTAGAAGSQERRAERVASTAEAWWAHALGETTRSGRRGALLASSNRLADEVLKLLEFREIPAQGGHTVVDPGMSHLVTTPEDGGEDSVLMISAHFNGRNVIVPICPATPTLRVYAHDKDGELGELLAEVSVMLNDDGWGSAAAIVDALYGPATTVSD